MLNNKETYWSRDKKLYDNKFDVEFGTGLFAEAGDGRQTPWRYQDADGNWHTTIGQHPQPYLLPALDSNKQKIGKIISDAIMEALKNNA